MAKTDLYNERKREGRREEVEIEKAACSAGREHISVPLLGERMECGSRSVCGRCRVCIAIDYQKHFRLCCHIY